MGYFLRNQTYKRYWRGDAVTGEGYFLGHVWLFGALELPAVLSAVAVIGGGDTWPAIGPLAASAAVMAVNFPHGRPMRAEGPRLGERRDG